VSAHTYTCAISTRASAARWCAVVDGRGRDLLARELVLRGVDRPAREVAWPVTIGQGDELAVAVAVPYTSCPVQRGRFRARVRLVSARGI